MARGRHRHAKAGRDFRTGEYYRIVDDVKRALIRVALQTHNGNRTHAARALGLQRTYLLALIRRLGVKA